MFNYTRAFIQVGDRVLGNPSNDSLKLRLGYVLTSGWHSYVLIKGVVQASDELMTNNFVLKFGEKANTSVEARVVTAEDGYTGEWSGYIARGMLCRVDLSYDPPGVIVENLHSQAMQGLDDVTQLRAALSVTPGPTPQSKLRVYVIANEDYTERLNDIPAVFTHEKGDDPVLRWHARGHRPQVQSGQLLPRENRPMEEMPTVRVFEDFTEYMTLNGYAEAQEQEHRDEQVTRSKRKHGGRLLSVGRYTD
jgi:hypothetical protein